MNNLNIGVLASSLLAATGLGVYVYMNNNDDNLEYVNNEISKNDEQDEEENENDKNIKSTKKSVSIKTKRRATKNAGTRRKR